MRILSPYLVRVVSPLRTGEVHGGTVGSLLPVAGRATPELDHAETDTDERVLGDR